MGSFATTGYNSCMYWDMKDWASDYIALVPTSAITGMLIFVILLFSSHLTCLPFASLGILVCYFNGGNVHVRTCIGYGNR
jgi:hypothetical protein